jgi:hypothetical protein
MIAARSLAGAADMNLGSTNYKLEINVNSLGISSFLERKVSLMGRPAIRGESLERKRENAACPRRTSQRSLGGLLL